MPLDPERLRLAAAAVARLRTGISRSLAGGPDLAEAPDASSDLSMLECCDALVDRDRREAFARAILDPSSLAGTSRRVVLARGQRFLLTLAIAIDDALDEPAPRSAKRERSVAPPPSEVSTFDPALLDLPGVGPRTAQRLSSRGLASPTDLLFWLPRRYDDRRTVTEISALAPGQRAVTRGTISKVRVFGRPWRRIMELTLEDARASVVAIWFTNRRPKQDRFSVGDELTIAGLVSEYRGRLQIAHPIVVGDGVETDRLGRIVPVYAEVPGVAGRVVEKAIGHAARRAAALVADPIPVRQREARGLMSLPEALEIVHLPPADIDAERLDAWLDGSSPAHRRLAYDEFFYVQLALALRRREAGALSAPAIASDDDTAAVAGKLLGLSPTGAQDRAIREILRDMSCPSPMRRLLQGDVGSGKTLVALAAVLAAARAGYQSALMAPTEILAEQHMRTLASALDRLRIRAVLHIGQARSSARKRTLAAVESGAADLVIGTQALIQGTVCFSRLGLAVVDEQHRFGVAQRLGLVGKGPEGGSPHLLVMTATPIPRSLALTIHGDLDASILDERPPGRLPVKTILWSRSERERAIDALGAAVARGGQAYVVCSVIEESEHLDLEPAERVHAELRARFPETSVGLLHGRLTAEERDLAMERFVHKEISVLVSTTVIEVGVDVPSATFMMIDGAERFGLAQLHQLRGRVGRGAVAAECHLVAEPSTEDAAARLEALVRTSDGFEIAAEDLRIRGPGELYGRRQAGLPGFQFGDLARDADLLEAARTDVGALLAEDPGLCSPTSMPLREELARRMRAGDDPVAEESG